MGIKQRIKPGERADKQPLSSTFALFDSLDRYRGWEMTAFMVKWPQPHVANKAQPIP
jgi:hypothetical protein